MERTDCGDRLGLEDRNAEGGDALDRELIGPLESNRVQGRVLLQIVCNQRNSPLSPQRRTRLEVDRVPVLGPDLLVVENILLLRLGHRLHWHHWGSDRLEERAEEERLEVDLEPRARLALQARELRPAL